MTRTGLEAQAGVKLERTVHGSVGPEELPEVQAGGGSGEDDKRTDRRREGFRRDMSYSFLFLRELVGPAR